MSDARGELLSRDKIEEAMDAYERYRDNGDNSKFFGGSNDLQEYWVRSSKPRPNPVFPAGPIARFIYRAPTFDGSTLSEKAASTVLYNCGYFILDKKKSQ